MRISLLALAVAWFGAQDPPRAEGAFTVTHFRARLDEAPVVLLERPACLRYLLPYFTANATVRCTVPRGETYTVGFIQQVDAMDLRNEYARATTSWEMPRFPLYDCASVAEAPWYGTLHEIRRVEGGTSDLDVDVAMDDNLSGSVTWREPLPPDGQKLSDKPELVSVKRKQSFTTWLVARREPDGHLTVLRKTTWSFDLEIAVDPTRPVGARGTAKLAPVRQPAVGDGKGESVPPEATKGPGANAVQEFWWTPKIEGIGKRRRLSS
jgi:hypothetical protein